MDLNVAKYDHILICPLDWGLGHATRCIPLIDQFRSEGKKVSIAGSGPSLDLIRIEYPDIQTFELVSYKISYPKKSKYFSIHMALQSPKIISAISKEKHQIQAILDSEHINLIISDNRYGCYSEKCRSVFLSHQLNIVFPKGLQWLNKVNETLILEFDEIWVPDKEDDENLSGRLSHESNLKNIKFIGPLSRFKNGTIGSEYDILALISGPEPQRSVFEELMISKLESSELNCALLRGLPNSQQRMKHPSIDIFNHLPKKELNDLILKSEKVVCRSGYSSIMDLYKLGKGALLVPTPGQSEQEYLGDHLNGKFGFKVLEQKDLKGFEFRDLVGNIFSH